LVFKKSLRTRTKARTDTYDHCP